MFSSGESIAQTAGKRKKNPEIPAKYREPPFAKCALAHYHKNHEFVGKVIERRNNHEQAYRPKDPVEAFYHDIIYQRLYLWGGFVIVTFMKRKFVDELHWLEEDEMLDLAALAQASPGAAAFVLTVFLW